MFESPVSISPSGRRAVPGPLARRRQISPLDTFYGTQRNDEQGLKSDGADIACYISISRTLGPAVIIFIARYSRY